MKKSIALLLVVLMFMAGLSAAAEEYSINGENVSNFNALLGDLFAAYDTPTDGDAKRIEADLDAVRAVSETDYEVARRIADHWQTVYLDASYPLYIHDGGERATALEQAMPADIGAHAIVVLGYELKDGGMTEELMGRCEAAAAVARSFPDSILVCSGGATGKNNPEQHTEAGLMKVYLAENCGIDAARIFIDEQAMTTVENAVNTFVILEANGIDSITIVTSTYHQRWGQAVYNAVGALYEKTHGYSAKIVENYCFDIEPSNTMFNRDAQIAIMQMTSVLGLTIDGKRPQQKAGRGGKQ